MGVLGTKIKPLTDGQKRLVRVLKNKKSSLIGVFGPTGTGKSLLTLAYGVDAVKAGTFERLVVAKPIVDVETGKEITMVEMGEQYREVVMGYLRDLMAPYLGAEELEKIVNEGKIELADTHYLRGRSFDKSLVLVDDVQNIPVESSLEIISRIGRNSKLVLAGDPVFQADSTQVRHVVELRELLLGEDDAEVVDLGLSDIVRPGAKRAVRLLLELRMRKRPLTDEEKKVVEVIKRYSPDAEIVTVVDCRSEKKLFQIPENTPTPDFLVVVKEGHHGRLVGRGGERIEKAEKELGMRLRGAEASLNLAGFIKSLHPVPWSIKHVKKVDLEGNNIVIYIEQGKAGPLLGRKGVYIKFVEAIMMKLLGTPVIAREE